MTLFFIKVVLGFIVECFRVCEEGSFKPTGGQLIKFHLIEIVIFHLIKSFIFTWSNFLRLFIWSKVSIMHLIKRLKSCHLIKSFINDSIKWKNPSVLFWHLIESSKNGIFSIIKTFDQVPKKNLRILALDRMHCWLRNRAKN